MVHPELPAAPDRSAAATAPALVDELAQRQWLLTDGLGGYATGNGLDLPRRRYDSWLTVMAPGGRRVRLVAGVEERVVDAHGEHLFAAAHWRSLAAPSVPELARTFRVDPLPRWTLRKGDTTLERTMAMAAGTPGVLVRWRNIGPRRLRLCLRPLLAAEDADALLRERAVDEGTEVRDGAFEFALATSLGRVWMSVSQDVGFRREPCWYRDWFLAVDAERGYDAVGDRFSPGRLEIDLVPDESVVVAFSLGGKVDDPAGRFAAALQHKRQRVLWAERAGGGLAQRLRQGVDDFFYRAPGGRLGVLAGFPWFGEWGRDVFLALPGLTLAVGEPERCIEVLRSAVPFLRGGLLPNIFGLGVADSHYGSADAALWFSLCVQRWQDAGADVAEVRREFAPVLQQIVAAYRAGTELGLCVDGDGMLCAGTPDHNATWMDAQTSRGPVTPRDGQPVEIAALWCGLLQHLGELLGGEHARTAAAVGRVFVERFWRRDGLGLYDRWHDGKGDPAVRPNMVLAAAMPRSPLSRQQRQAIVDVAARELVTARGLRTLSRGDPAYRGRYEGGPEQRDAAYHQGTVWPWLAGAFVEASLRSATPERLPAVRAGLLAWLQGFVAEIDRTGIAHLAEVFDGDAPQRAGGTFAQAWNSGELLRALQLCIADGREPRP